jgi:NADPH:quinone reductase-like Zn-dependent oxidoreductase
MDCGFEAVGTVVAIGDKVTNFKIGQAVALTRNEMTDIF